MKDSNTVSAARDRMIAWLSRVAVEHVGAMPSWINATRPGYAYPEAAGLVTTVLAQVRPADPALPGLTQWLLAQVADGRLVGREGRGYAFDTSIVLTGLLAARQAGQTVAPVALEPVFTTLVHAIESRRAVDDPDASPRWSTRWSCHQLKLAWVLSHYDEVVGDARAAALIDHAALAELLELELDGRFRVSTTDPRTYVHAACYGLEGLLGLQRRGRLVQPALERGAAWLASIQADDGSLPSWVTDDQQAITRPSDVIAQAIRIWLLVDRTRHADAITRAIAQLLLRQHESGGLRYVPESEDVNAWSTAFAVQALSWLASPPDDPWIA